MGLKGIAQRLQDLDEFAALLFEPFPDFGALEGDADGCDDGEGDDDSWEESADCRFENYCPQPSLGSTRTYVCVGNRREARGCRVAEWQLTFDDDGAHDCGGAITTLNSDFHQVRFPDGLVEESNDRRTDGLLYGSIVGKDTGGGER